MAAVFERRAWRVDYSDHVEALVGPGSRRSLGSVLASLKPSVDKVAVVVDSGVPAGLAEAVTVSVEENGLPVSVRVLPGGEAAKSLETVLGLWEWMLGEELTRHSVLVAVGGGAVTDSAGFAAATYMRGIRWVTVPTTLLGMADAAVGGKTAVNLAGKNMVGAFHQPRLIVADVEFASSLPEREYRSGLAEVAKHSLIRGSGFYRWLRGSAGLLLHRDAEALSHAVAESIDVKMSIVARDPREETGLRAVLNLGHTYAHALEKATGYRMSHGYAVAIGLVVESKAAERLAGTDPAVTREVEQLLGLLELPTRPPVSPGCEETVAHIRLDKKRRGDSLLLPVLRAVGNVDLLEVPLEHARRELARACRELQGAAPKGATRG